MYPLLTVVLFMTTQMANMILSRIRRMIKNGGYQTKMFLMK